MAALIPQPFTAYLPPCLETLAREGAAFGRQDTKICLGCIALHYRIEAQKSNPPISDDDYDLLPMLRHINKLSHEPISDQELEQIDVEVRCSKRSKLTCRELKRSETLKNCCVPEDCALCGDSELRPGQGQGQGLDPGIDPAIHEKALAIAQYGDPLRYLIWQAQRNHLGDIDYQKVLISSTASAASLTSNGIQPGGTGEKGSGKSNACAAVYHLIPPDRRLDGSLSPMSLFYLQETGRLKPGMVLFSDDVEYEPIIPIYKRATARFQQGISHFSVSSGRSRQGIELKVPPRIIWWLTSVEGVANEQAFDRQYPISTDSSYEHKKRVAREIAARRARKELKLADDEGIEIARAIIADIFANGPFKVLIPQAERAEWLKVSDFRGQEQFWDLVDALVILRWRQHKQDPDGWLIAKDSDLVEAKAILTHHKVAHFADLTEAEVKVVGMMSSGQPMTQKDLTEALGIAQSTLSERLRSIMAKSAIITEDNDHGKKVYTLNPNMQLKREFWNALDLIDIKTDISEDYRSRQIALSACYRYVIGIPIGIIINISSRIPSSLSVDKKVCMERGYPCDDCEKCPLKKYHLHISEKRPITDQNQQQEPLSDTDKPNQYPTDKTDNAIGEGTGIPIRQTGDAVGEKKEHDKDPVNTDTPTASLPDDYQDPPYNPLQPSYNHDTTKFTTIETNNGKPNHTDIQPNPEKCSKDGCNLSGCTSEPYHAQENGCKVVNSPLAIDQPGCEEVVNSCEGVVNNGCTTDTTILRFFAPVSAFTGVDMREYGPFRPEDVATVPTIHAKNLIASGYAREIVVSPPSSVRSIEEQNKAREEHFAKLAAKYTKDAAQESDVTS